MKFSHPEPHRISNPVYPVFIPFAGCKTRCVFCAQTLQTGVSLRPVSEIIESIEEFFALKNSDKVFDIAFYGGTFTCIPQEHQNAFLAQASRLKREGKIGKVRCSTRPDAITPASLEHLYAQGLDFIELGIQSFCDAPLARSRRGYNGVAAHAACTLIKSSDIGLGIQLMPGMPGMSTRHFAEDIKLCTTLEPETVRLYPCLVLQGTELAEDWRQGGFTPWSIETVLNELPEAVLTLWRHGSKIIRMGLAPEDGMKEGILAGPEHPALGQVLRSRALCLFLKQKLNTGYKHMDGKVLYAPQKLQGEFFGHKGDLVAEYASFGISKQNVRWWANNYFELTPAAN